MEYILLLCFVWNIAVFLLYGVDKLKAKFGAWRISEKTLILCAFLMGGAGAWLGMTVFHHKTQKTKFKLLIPLAVAFNIAVTFASFKLFGVA